MKFSNLNLEQSRKDLAEIIGLLPKGSKVLDVGAGNGANAELIKQKCSVVAVEPDEQGAKFIRDRGIECLNAKLQDIEHQEKYDRILFLKFNIPFDEISPSLKKAKTLLAKDGQIIFDICRGEYDTQSLQNFSDKFEEAGLGCFSREIEGGRFLIILSPDVPTININSSSRGCFITKNISEGMVVPTSNPEQPKSDSKVVENCCAIS
jgi:hypothetical protein